ncbi:ABC transporter permease [Ralstonia pickettii]|nr:ABC transporter permease [Ralstonia pickettii]
MILTQLRYDLIMFSREIFYLVFSLIIPPVSYIFLGQLFGENSYAGGLSYAEAYTPSFILLITFSVVFFAFGFEQVVNRSSGVEKRVLLSPVPKRVLLISNILKSVIITSFGYLMIQVLGLFFYGLSFHIAEFLVSYVFFILLNAILLVIATAVYSFFQDMKNALIFSIVVFQLVMFTGDFALPVQMMPKIIQIIAYVNPLYHMNHLFIAIWNWQFQFHFETFLSIGYILLLLIFAFFIIQKNKKAV